jgi:hypothetical protein
MVASASTAAMNSWWGTAVWVAPRRGETGTRNGATRRSWARQGMEHARDARRGATRRGMRAPPRGGLGRADGAVSRNQRSEELEISVGFHIVDEVDRGERA